MTRDRRQYIFPENSPHELAVKCRQCGERFFDEQIDNVDKETGLCVLCYMKMEEEDGTLGKG